MPIFQCTLYCLYSPSNKDSIFDGISIHGLLRSLPLPFSENFSVDDFQPVTIGISLLHFDAPSLIDDLLQRFLLTINRC